MKIVVRGTNWVGDAVMQIPALRELRRVYPDSHITLATRSRAQGIFEDADFIDGILPFEKSDSIFKQAKMWREGKFDLAILFTNSFESALVARLGGVKNRFGYATENRSFFLTDSFPVPRWKNSRHEIYYYLNIASEAEKRIPGASKICEQNPEFGLTVSDTRKEAVRKILNDNGVDADKKLIVFCPGSTNSRAKRWQTTSYAELNDKIQRNLKAEVVLIGSPDEITVSLEVAENSKLKPIVLTGKTSLAEVTAILSVCDLLVSNDTGPAHIAAALGTKTIAVFGPTNPLTTSPVNAEIIRKDVECSPCMLRDCPIDHRCMTQISADELFQNLVNLLNLTV